jgi:glycerate kinase
VRTVFEDAPRVYGPQKGADARLVKRLEGRLDKLAAKAPRDPRGVRMTGAAGGLAGGLYAYMGAKLAPGAAYVLDTIGFDERMREARFVVTGEGRLDSQTLAGKAAGEVAVRCRQSGVACHAVVGSNALDDFEIRLLDLASVNEAKTKAKLRKTGMDLAELAR